MTAPPPVAAPVVAAAAIPVSVVETADDAGLASPPASATIPVAIGTSAAVAAPIVSAARRTNAKADRGF